MADRDTRLNINVTAEDRASQVIRDVKDDVDALEQSDPTIDVQADDNASPVLDDVQGDARDLDGTTATVDVQADDNASPVLDDVQADIRDLDGRTAQVDVRADVDEARRLLDQIDSKLRELDGRRAGVSVGGAVAAGAAGGAVAGEGLPIVEDVVRGATSAGDFVIQVEQLSRTTGATREEASRLARVWQGAGLDLQDLLDLMANLQAVIRDQPDLREKLNLSLANDGVTTFLQTVQNLQTEFDTAGDRSQAAAKLFGEEGQRQVDRVLVLVRDDLRGAMDDIADTRLISDKDLENARELNRDSQELAGWWQQIQLSALSFAHALTEPIGPSDSAILRSLGILNTRDPLVNNLPTFINSPRPPSTWDRLSDQVAPTTWDRLAQTVIVNPPGTPSTTNQQQERHLSRNGVRLS